MSETKVVVTGAGVVSPLGNRSEDLWEAVAGGETGVRPVETQWGKQLRLSGWSPVTGFRPEPEWAAADRQIQFAVSAAQSAAREAQISKFDLKERAAVYLSSSKGGIDSFQRLYSDFIQGKGERNQSDFFSNFWAHSPASAVSIHLGIQGPVSNFVSACASGAHSVLMGSRLIQNHPDRIVLAGSTEASLTPLILSAFANLGVLARGNRFKKDFFAPYDQNRLGFAAGEGAAVVVLESWESAQKRGVPVLAEFAGGAALSDATHMIRFDPEGESIYRTIQTALDKSGLSPDEIDSINLHATATKENDLVESRALKKIWSRSSMPALSCTKPATGHLLGASGAIEAVLTILTLKHQFVLPTLNCKNPDPECGVAVTPDKGYSKKCRGALSLSYGFGGHTAALVFKAAEGD